MIPIKRILQFRVRREEWNRYELFGGKLEIGLKFVLLNVAEIDTARAPPPADGVNRSAQQISVNHAVIPCVLYCDVDMLGKPDPTPVTEEEMEKRGRDVPFRRVDEVENEYLILGTSPERVFTTRVVATGMARFLQGRYNQHGMPVVGIPNQVAIGRPRDLTIEEAGA